MFRLIIKLFILFVGSLSASGVRSEQMYSQWVRSIPEFDSSVIAQLGERLVSTETGEFRDCLVPSFDHYKNFLGAVYTIKAHVPICRRSPSDNLFRPPYFSYVYGASVEDMPVVFEQKKNRNNDFREIFF